MTERAVTFGAHGTLVGVVAEPATPGVGTRAVLMSNIGMHHRIGPFRLYVELSRALAASGLFALRFDVSGMGDSAPRRETGSPTALAARDLDDAMTFMTAEYGVTEFVLVGLCSGVDSTHAVAALDTRVRGAVFIDGYSYPTLGYTVRRAVLRPLQPGRWVRLARRLVNGQHRRAAGAAGAVVFAREEPTQSQFANDVLAMSSRNTRLLFLYTGGVTYRFNSPRQLREMLGVSAAPAGIECALMPQADHVFSRTDQRRALCDRVTRWCVSLPV